MQELIDRAEDWQRQYAASTQGRSAAKKVGWLVAVSRGFGGSRLEPKLLDSRHLPACGAAFWAAL